jgi:UDP-N-acetyl-D-glucosamine dehydrogenase
MTQPGSAAGAEYVILQDQLSALLTKIENRSAVVAVMGLGYTGLPLALTAASAKFRTIGLELDADKVRSINGGESYIRHVASATIAACVASGDLVARLDETEINNVDIVVICVPTPVKNGCEPDISYIFNAGQSVARNMRAGQLVILESTTFPGTTTGVLRDVLQASHMQSGRDFYLAYSPEREDPGNTSFSTAQIARVVGGDGADALAAATAFYDALVVRTVPVSSPETAEAVKLTENIFRCVNIALINELKAVFTPMGIDIWEVIEAAKTKPFGFMPFYPGPGVGGHCIQIDPYYLTWTARAVAAPARLVELACEINRLLPEQVVRGIGGVLEERRPGGLEGSAILLLGVAYKKNVDDVRESPALYIMDLLERRGALVSFHDPYVPVIPALAGWDALQGRKSVAIDGSLAASYDAIIVTTDHDGLDYAGIVEKSRLVIDTRNACFRHGIVSKHVIKL